ncbi:MAG: 3-oxoacyl-ACP synthase III family protein [Gemmataceae bacterium]
MISARIAATGSALPAAVLTSAALERQLGLPAGWIVERTGVHERRRAVAETTLSLAAAAARAALADAPGPLDAVVVASAGPHQLIPCTAALVHRELGLPEGPGLALDVNATCLSFLHGLNVAAGFVHAGTARRVLVVSSEVSRHCLDPEEPESTVLIGDGAAAAVVEPGGTINHALFETHSRGADLTTIKGGGSLHHPNDPATTPAHNRFRMNGPAIFKLALHLLPPFVDRALAGAGWRADEVDAVVPHQASRPGVELLVRRCGFRPEQLVLNLQTRGNCVAASIPLALDEAVRAGRVVRGHKVLLIGTAAGFAMGAVALTF